MSRGPSIAGLDGSVPPDPPPPLHLARSRRRSRTSRPRTCSRTGRRRSTSAGTRCSCRARASTVSSVPGGRASRVGRASERCGSPPNVRQQRWSPSLGGFGARLRRRGGRGRGRDRDVVELRVERAAAAGPAESPIARRRRRARARARDDRSEDPAKGSGHEREAGRERPASQCASSSGAVRRRSVGRLGAAGRRAERQPPRQAEDAPGQRILEEARVQERVHDEHEQDRAEPDAEASGRAARRGRAPSAVAASSQA